MKRITIYIMVLAVATLIPMRGMDIGKLRPVGLIQLYKEAGEVFIVTDTGDSGYGETVDKAFDNLEDTTSGVIFLDTADYLLISETAKDAAMELGQYVKPTIEICIAEKDIDPIQAAEYLAVHHPEVKLRDENAFRTVQKLTQENGRMILKKMEEKDENN